MLFHVGSDPSNLFEDEKKTVADKYTQKVRHLLELKNKLSREEILLKEQRYLLGDNGHYELIHSIKQKELICGCTLFNLMNLKENEILKKNYEAEIVPSPKATIDMIIDTFDFSKCISGLTFEHDKKDSFLFQSQIL